MDVLKIFLIATVILFPFGELLRIPLGNNIQLNIIDIPVALSGLFWLIKKTNYSKLNQLAPFIAFILIAITSLLVNLSWLKMPEVFTSAFYLIRWIAYVLVYFAVAGYNEKFKLFLKKSLIVAGGFIVTIGYIQFFFFSSLKPLYYMGWDEHMYRMVTSFLDPNFAGAFFVLYALLLAERVHNHTLKLPLLHYFLLAITIVAIFLTYSRSAIIMLIVSSVVYLFLIKRKKLILLVFAIVLTAFLVTLPFFHTENFNLLRVNSSKARWISLTQAVQIIQDSPIIGIGFNTYRYAQLKYGFRDTHSPIPSNANAGTDNSFLFILATTGIFGFLIYMNIWRILIFYCFKKQTTLSQSSSRIIFISSIAGLFIDCLFINSLFYPPIMLWIWMLAGISHSE